MTRTRTFFAVLLLAVVITAFASQPLAQTFAQGNVVADLGFRADANGLPFENYGPGNYTNLTSADMRRVYGDQVCASLKEDKCLLTPVADQYMKQLNDSMAGGHCYGFSVYALLAFTSKLKTTDFGADTIAGLKIDGNEKLQREIAIAWAYQKNLNVLRSALGGTPNEILATLLQNFKEGKNAKELYTFGFFRRDGKGGHAVTPYAIEDRGNGIAAVLLWDNNWPGKQREMIFDTNKNTWTYNAAINPNEPESTYDGDADTKSLFLFPTYVGQTTPWPCPFCETAQASNVLTSFSAQTVAYNEIYLDRDPKSEAHLLITDEQGRHYGYLDGKFVTEIPGVKHDINFSADLFKDSEEPTYRVPVGMKFFLTVDGTALKGPDTANVVMIGPGYTLGVYDIKLDPGQKDVIEFAADGSKVSYKTFSEESPEVVLSFSSKAGADYEFSFKGLKVSGGASIDATLDQKKALVTFDTEGAKDKGTYAFTMNRYDQDGEASFEHDGIELDPKNTIYIDYSKWTGQGAELTVGVGVTGSGKIDEQVTLKDEK